MRINEVPATTGYGEPITKFFKLGDGVRVVGAVTTDARFTPADQDAKGDTPGGPYVIVATANGYVLRTPFAGYRTESTKAGRRYVKLEEGDKVVMARQVGDETGVMLASRGGHVIHFPIDQVNVLAGVGKGVIGIKLEPGDECIGGALVNDARRYETNRIVVETESGKPQEFGPLAIKSHHRGGKGEKPGSRTKFARVVPPPIVLVNWDEVDGKAPKKEADRNGEGNGSLFDR
jgi:DNA gyrase subunit A